MKNVKYLIILIIIIILVIKYRFGNEIDNLNGVSVFYNGKISNTFGKNITNDGYNLGLKYQCVEFVKRYYYQYFNHKMPNSYGNAKDFFDKSLNDCEVNKILLFMY